MKVRLSLTVTIVVLLVAILSLGTVMAQTDDCTTWICEQNPLTGLWSCYWYLPPSCPALATPVPLSTYVATVIATVQGQYPNPLPPRNPLVQPCEQDGYAYDGQACLACADSPYPNVSSLSVCQPCQSVTRQPYPRGMVGVENRFALYGPATTQASVQVCDTKDDCYATINEKNVRDVKYYLKWVRADDQSPVWGWDERPWNVQNHGSPDTGFGWQAVHTYQTSSYSLTGPCTTEPDCDKPMNGPSQTAGEKLPAYQVEVRVPWRAQYRVTYQALRHWSKCAWTLNTSSCCAGNEDLPGECTPQVHEPHQGGDHGCHTVHRDCVQANQATSYDDPICWLNRDTGWKDIDMQLVGSPYPYIYGRRAGSEATALEGGSCDSVNVPIIEVQGVLDKNRP